MDDNLITFDDYLYSRKIQLLYRLYEQLYGLICLLPSEVDRWNLWSDEEGCMAELKNTEQLSIDVRLSLHKAEYRKYKSMITVSFDKNGFVRLF